VVELVVQKIIEVVGILPVKKLMGRIGRPASGPERPFTVLFPVDIRKKGIERRRIVLVDRRTGMSPNKNQHIGGIAENKQQNGHQAGIEQHQPPAVGVHDAEEQENDNGKHAPPRGTDKKNRQILDDNPIDEKKQRKACKSHQAE